MPYEEEKRPIGFIECFLAIGAAIVLALLVWPGMEPAWFYAKTHMGVSMVFIVCLAIAIFIFRARRRV